MAHAAASDLPRTLPVFPLAGVLLLPGNKLPLNIFEPRYLDMVTDAMGGHRLIGMVQPAGPGRDQMTPEIFPVGGAGRITAYRETDDGRFLITLSGVSRFRVAEELAVTTRYRQVKADWAPFADDLEEAAATPPIDRDRLLRALAAYLKLLNTEADWNAVEKAPSASLVDHLAMICPFQASEKQALLEAPDAAERARVLTTLIEMAIVQRSGGGGDGRPRPFRRPAGREETR
jgi:Lon protease-like protein